MQCSVGHSAILALTPCLLLLSLFQFIPVHCSYHKLLFSPDLAQVLPLYGATPKEGIMPIHSCSYLLSMVLIVSAMLIPMSWQIFP